MLRQKLIKARFLDNPHRVTVVGKADPTYDAKLEEAEKHHVSALAAALDEGRKQEIVREAVALRDAQDSVQDASILPTLVVADAGGLLRTSTPPTLDLLLLPSSSARLCEHSP